MIFGEAKIDKEAYLILIILPSWVAVGANTFELSAFFSLLACY